MKISLVAVAALAFLSQASTWAVEKYAIELTRKYQVGQKFEISAVATEARSMDLKVNGAPAPTPPGQNEDIDASIEGEEEILEVKEDGSQAKTRVKIKKCVAKDSDGEARVIVEPGTEVIVTFGKEKATFTVGGKGANAKQAKVLSKFFETKKSGTDDDDVLGTDEKQALGDKWKIDSKTVAKSLTENGMALKPEDIEGWMKLESVVEKDGVRCLEIHGEVTLKKMQAPMPPGITIGKSGGKMTLRGLFPIDSTLQPISKLMTMSFNVEAAGTTNGADIAVSITGKTKRDGSLKAIE